MTNSQKDLTAQFAVIEKASVALQVEGVEACLLAIMDGAPGWRVAFHAVDKSRHAFLPPFEVTISTDHWAGNQEEDDFRVISGSNRAESVRVALSGALLEVEMEFRRVVDQGETIRTDKEIWP